MIIEKLLELMLKKEASDLHIKANSSPLLRVHGDLLPLKEIRPFTQEEAENLSLALLTDAQKERFKRDLFLDLCMDIKDLSRFRTHIFYQQRSVASVFRAIPYKIPTMDELKIPSVVKSLCTRPRGMILVTGPASSGKSTTLAALIDFINENSTSHIVTVEDPIEFIHSSKKAVINQRQVGSDTLSFKDALKHMFRQDPDIILVGEMRDLETIQTAITAAETGHLVLATLHTPDATQTIDRIIDVFPPHQQQQVRIQLASNLQGIMSQVLLKRADGKGRIAAFEVLIAVPAVRNLIREGRTYQIPSFLQVGRRQGMISLNQSLIDLSKEGLISPEEAISKATDVAELLSVVTGEGEAK
ncbi:MAG: type IV pilus twitching motility protein PilT [bacterium]